MGRQIELFETPSATGHDRDHPSFTMPSKTTAALPKSIIQIEVTRGPPTPEKAEALREALTVAKRTIKLLRERIVRSDSVAYVWATAAEPGPLGDVKRKCGEMLRQIFVVDGDASLRSTIEELDRNIDAHLVHRKERKGS